MFSGDHQYTITRSTWVRVSLISLVAVFIALSAQLVYIRGYGGNPAALIGMPQYVADRAGDVPASVPRFTSGGHDGGYVYLVARRPFRVDVDIENTKFHVERWLYPLSAWALALGQQSWLPYSLPLVNLLATGLIALFCGLALHLRGLNSWWAVVCALGPGAAMPLRFNLVDQYFLAWICGAFLCFDLRKRVATTFLLALSVLTRPTAIGAVLAAVGGACFQRRDEREAGLYALAILPYFAWRGWLASSIGYPMFTRDSILFTGDSTLFTIPFLASSVGLVPTLYQVGAFKFFLLIVTVAFYYFVMARLDSERVIVRSYYNSGLFYCGHELPSDHFCGRSNATRTLYSHLSLPALLVRGR